MTNEAATTAVDQTSAAEFPLGAWIRANAFGFGLAFGLFALVGGALEAMGAGHDSVARNLPAMLAMAAGGVALAVWRRAALGAHHTGVPWHLLIIGLCLPAGFVLGIVAPLDWTVALLLTGTVGGAWQLRALRRVTARSLLAGAGGWLAAGVAATVAVVALMDGVVVGLLGVDMAAIDADPGVPSAALFTAAFVLLGLAGGAVGGAIEGAISRRGSRWRR
jgi:hypothetical protein